MARRSAPQRRRRHGGRRSVEAEGAGAEFAAAMEAPGTEGFPEDGGANGCQGRDRMSASRCGIGDSEGEVEAARANLTTPPSRRPSNFPRQFRTPQLNIWNSAFPIFMIRRRQKVSQKKVEDGLARLFQWYAEADAAGSNSEPLHAPLVVDLEEYAEDPRRLWASNFKEHLQVIESKAANTELSTFLSELCEKDTDEFDILNWWSRQRRKYPTLSKVAKDVLAVPVSTVASESSFSIGGRVINPQRSSLSPKMVEALICGQSWLRSSPNKIDIRQTIEDLHKYEELARELGALECGET